MYVQLPSVDVTVIICWNGLGVADDCVFDMLSSWYSLKVDNTTVNANNSIINSSQSNFTAVASSNNYYVSIYVNGTEVAPLTKGKAVYLKTLPAGLYKVTAHSNSSGILNVTYYERVLSSTVSFSDFQEYQELNISNTQSSATPSPFQQMITVTSTDGSWTYINTSQTAAFGQNVEFFYANGTVIPSWLESYTSSSAIWWVKVGSIPANSKITIYMGLVNKTKNLFNTVNDGEAPQLSSTYAEYDDGANVFNSYWNFNGTSLPTGWTSAGGYSGSVNNGLTLTSSSDWGGVSSGPINANPSIILDSYYIVTSAQAIITGFSTSTSFSSIYSYYNSYQYDAGSGSSYTGTGIGEGSSSAQTSIVSGTLPIAANSNYNVYSAIFNSSGVAFKQDYEQVDSGSSTYLSSASYVFISDYSGAVMNIKWLRTRAYPPNGIMPSITFGSVS